MTHWGWNTDSDEYDEDSDTIYVDTDYLDSDSDIEDDLDYACETQEVLQDELPTQGAGQAPPLRRTDTTVSGLQSSTVHSGGVEVPQYPLRDGSYPRSGFCSFESAGARNSGQPTNWNEGFSKKY